MILPLDSVCLFVSGEVSVSEVYGMGVRVRRWSCRSMVPSLGLLMRLVDAWLVQ